MSSQMKPSKTKLSQTKTRFINVVHYPEGWPWPIRNHYSLLRRVDDILNPGATQPNRINIVLTYLLVLSAMVICTQLNLTNNPPPLLSVPSVPSSSIVLCVENIRFWKALRDSNIALVLLRPESVISYPLPYAYK